MMGTGYARGKTYRAAEAAIKSPLLEEVDLNGAERYLQTLLRA